MRKTFVCDRIHYVIDYANNNFNFWVDYDKTEVKLVKNDPFGDPPPRRIVSTIGNTRCAFRVKKEVERFMADVIAANDPYYFTFAASDDKRLKVYFKLAERIAEKYGYFVHIDRLAFHFYKV